MGSADNKGTDYEVGICALIFLRSLRFCTDFYVGSNHDKAGAFDDAVLVYRMENMEKYRVMLLQAKHKKNKNNLVKLNNLKGFKSPFSLRKYYASYLEVKDNWDCFQIKTIMVELEKVTFVLFTNANADANLGSSVAIFPSELTQILQTGGNIVQFQYSDVINILLESENKMYMYKNPIISEIIIRDEQCFSGGNVICIEYKEVDSGIDISNCAEFLTNLIFCYNQMSYDSIHTSLDEEINLLFNSSPPNRRDICNLLINSVKDWWEEEPEEVEYLTKDSEFWKLIVNTQMQRINKKIIDLNYQINLSFSLECREQILSFLEKSNHFEVLVSNTHEASIVKIKLYQCLEKILFIDAETSENQLEESVALFKMPFCNIIVVDISLGLINCAEYKNIICYSFENPKYLILITNKLTEVNEWSIYKENLVWADLDVNCRKQLLSVPVKFQGISYFMENIVAMHSPSLSVTFSCENILDLAEKPKEIIVGQNHLQYIQYYIPQRLLGKRHLNDSFFKCVVGEKSIVAIVGVNEDNLKEKYFVGFNIYSYEEIMKQKHIGNSVIVKLLLKKFNTHFMKICITFNCKVYLVRFIEGEFIYIKGRGSLDNVREHLNDQLTENINSIWDINEKNIIISGYPGVGKSCLMKQMIDEARQKHKSDWILNLDVKKCIKTIREMKFECGDSVNTFILETCLEKPNNNSLEKTFLSYALKVSGNVIILIDSLDELMSESSELCHDFLQCFINNTKYNKLVVLTRPVFIKLVENTLNTISFQVSCFSVDEQHSFLRNFWHTKNIETSVEKTSNLIQNIGQGLGFPQIAFFTAEAILQGNFISDDVANMYVKAQLYDLFANRYFELFVEENNAIRILENVKLSLSLKLASLAVKTLLSEEEQSSVGFNEVKFSNVDSKLGILTFDGTTFGFIDSSFAEFFLGLWLSNNFVTCRSIIETKLFSKKFVFVRESFNYFLSHNFPVHAAVAGYDRGELNRLVLNYHGRFPVDLGGRTPLHIAAMSHRNDRDIWNILIDVNMNGEQRDKILNWTAINYAEAIGNWEMVEFLLNMGSSVSDMRVMKIKCKAKNILDYSCHQGFIMLPISILTLYPEIVNERLGGNYPLHCAAASGSVQLVSMLWRMGAKIDECNDENITPICTAAKFGRLEVVTLLLTIGASINAGNSTPLHCAAQSGHRILVNYLLSMGMFVDIEDQEKTTALILAAAYNQVSTLQLLLNEGASIQHRDIKGLTAMNWASKEDCKEAMSFLKNI